MNKAELFKNYSLTTGTVEVATWGGEVHIQELSAAAMGKMQESMGKEIEMAAIAVMYGVIEADGKRFFVDSDKSKLLEMSTSDLVKISAAIIELSDLGDDSGK